ncbi:hypothetical protein DAPPUDRAFT_319130 [Daphnia pulex]|uniref:Uncharacterized protein n=1 Tax=Daphnia pulex TaxID=6669 RepID=E9GKS3_DAPPU|nr:hypothetical protein DAPPUDRAFT_319130 [Daphnia pulex]|eukprot:EFX79917.1 hypothetical protein DAPPUDRAFT_319130 [Daphnia pulex]
MEFNSLIFLLMLVCSQTVSSIEIITESSRLWPNPFDRLFNATKFIRKPESQEKPDLEFYHPDDLKLLHTVKSQKIIPPQQLANDQQQPYPIAKLVEDLFPGFKFTTSRPRKSTHPPPPTSKEKVNRPVRKSEGSAPKKKRKHSKPFWGPPITTTSPRPRFYTRPTTRQNPLKNSQEDNIGDSEEHRPSDEEFLANPPTMKNSEAPVIKIKPSHPFWGPPFATSTTWPPYNTRTASSAIPRETEDDFPFHLSNVAINNNDISEHSTPFIPNVAELKQSYDQANSNERTLPEHFREPVHLKPGPPYQHETTSKQQQQQQEHHDPLDQNIWHPLTQTVTEPTFIPIPPKSDLPQQQLLLEPGVADNQEQHFPIYSGITPILDVSQLQSKETDSAALASYPKKTYPHPAKPETHVIYHQPPATHNNYYHPPTGLTHVDFSPIFLAIVPIALFLGAAAAFALASAPAVTQSLPRQSVQQQRLSPIPSYSDYYHILNDNDETKDMESYPLMLLPILVYCSLVVLNYETISVSGRRDDAKFWSNPFDKLVSASKFRKADAKPKKDFDFMMAFHPDDLHRAELPIKPQLRWDDRSSTASRYMPIKLFDNPVKITTQRPKPPPTKKKTFKKNSEAANEIHVQIDDVADLTDILGNSQHYQDIVFAIDEQQPDVKLADGNAPSKEKAPKPFWGPPIATPSPTARPAYYPRPTTRAVIPGKTKEENSIYKQTNIREHSATDPKIGDNNQPNEKPTTPDLYRETPVHMQSGPPYYEKRQENDPFEQGFWHKKYLEAGVSSNQDPHYSGTLETPVPAVIFKEIDSSAVGSYPAPYYPPAQDHHVVYHHPAPAHNNYYQPPSGFAQVDFSPIFLAIVPIAFHDDKKIIIITTTTTAAPPVPPPPPTLRLSVATKDVSPIEKLASATNQLVTLPPDKPLSEEDDLGDGFDQPGGGTVIEPPIMEEEEVPEILTYDL